MELMKESLYNKVLIPPEYMSYENIDAILSFVAKEFTYDMTPKEIKEIDLILVMKYVVHNSSVIFEITEEETVNLIKLHGDEKTSRSTTKLLQN